MSKYIIELDDRIKLVTSVGVTENGVVYTTSDYVHNLEELNSEYINENFGELQDEAYQKGFEDGKESKEKGCEGCKYESVKEGEPPCRACSKAYMNRYTPAPPSDRIEVGDEVIYNGTTKCIVVRPENDERYASLIDGDGSHHSADHRECKKTGKHYDIASILEAMRNDR